MDNFTDIKDIWLSANINALPGAGEMIKTIKRYRLKSIIKNISMVLLLLFMLAAMVWVVFVYKSHMITTRLGEACFFIAIFILLAIKADSLKRISAQKDYSNNSFIDFLKQEQQHQVNFFKRTQLIGFSFSAVGLLLYIFEEVHTDVIRMITGYSLLAIFFLAGWFIVRPIAIRKKTKKLNAMIEKLEGFSKQLSND